MPEPIPSLEERLRAAQEEAEALAWYSARHCPGGLGADASTAYSELVQALSAAHEREDESSLQELMVAYHKLACFTFDAHEVHGKSILDTTRKPRSFLSGLVDRRRLPVVLGVVFFGFALLFQVLDAWTKSVLGPDGAGGSTDGGSPEQLCAILLASCIPLLVPAAWGALGACTALAKRVADRLSAMSFEENRMQALTARIFLGAALALVLDILVFVEGGSAAGDGESLGFGPIAGAFLAGLFVQHIYGALETLMRRVSRAISPEPLSSSSTSGSPVGPGPAAPPAPAPAPPPVPASPPSPGSTSAAPAGSGPAPQSPPAPGSPTASPAASGRPSP